MDEINTALEITGLKFSQLQKHLKDNFLAMREGGKVTNRLTGQMQSYGQVIGQAALKARRFKFEWLSIMFAGMALDRVFGGLVRKQMDLWGVTETTGAMWTTIMIPTMENATEIIYELIDAFMGMPEPMKEMTGDTILLGFGLGKVITGLGQSMLLLGGLKILFGTSALAAGLWGAAIVVVAWGIMNTFRALRNAVKGDLTAMDLAFSGVTLNWLKQQGYIIELLKRIGKWFKKIFGGAKDDVEKLRDEAKKPIVFRIKAWISNFFRELLKLFPIGWLFGKAFKIKGFQAGGLVARTGPAMLHAGERVIPKGRIGREVMFSPTVYISATINSDMDVRILASKLNEYWAKDFERIAQGRGII